VPDAPSQDDVGRAFSSDLSRSALPRVVTAIGSHARSVELVRDEHARVVDDDGTGLHDPANAHSMNSYS
jgi:hypothetical protein